MEQLFSNVRKAEMCIDSGWENRGNVYWLGLRELRTAVFVESEIGQNPCILVILAFVIIVYFGKIED